MDSANKADKVSETGGYDGDANAYTNLGACGQASRR